MTCYGATMSDCLVSSALAYSGTAGAVGACPPMPWTSRRLLRCSVQRRLELGDWAPYARITLKQAAVLVRLGYVEHAATLLDGTIAGIAEMFRSSSDDLRRGLGAPACSPPNLGVGAAEMGRRGEGGNSFFSFLLRCAALRAAVALT